MAEAAPLLGSQEEYPIDLQDDEDIQSVPSTSTSYGAIPESQSCTNIVGAHPYTNSTKPNRRPFHVPGQREPLNPDSELYARFRYYSRLRAPADATEHALVMPDHIVPVDLFLPFIPYRPQTNDGKQDSIITIIAIWNTMMGTSLLSMPWAFGQAGFVGGLMIMFLMVMVCLYTAYRMLVMQKTIGLEGEMHEIGYLCRCLWQGTLGFLSEGFVVTFSLITLIGALIVYWVLMSNFSFNTGESIYAALYGNISTVTLGNSSFRDDVLCPVNMTAADYNAHHTANNTLIVTKWWQMDLSVPIYLVIPFSILLSIKNTKIFTYFNSLGAISVVVLYVFVIVKASGWGFNVSFEDHSNMFYVPLFKDTFMALSGTLSLAYFIHNCVITILKSNRYPENNARDLSIAYMLVASTYIPIAVIFYMTFPLPKYCIADNFLNNFPHDPLLATVRGFLLFQMMTVFPLLAYFVRSQFFSYFLSSNKDPNWIQMGLINSSLLTLCVIVAIFYPNIGFIIRWVGSISGLAYIFVIPCLMYMQALHHKGKLTYRVIIPHVLLILLGSVNFVSQFFLS